MKNAINQFINYGLNRGLINNQDVQKSKNCLIQALGESDFSFEIDSKVECFQEPLDLLMIEASNKKKFHPDTTDERDAYEALLFDCIMPTPQSTKEMFRHLFDIEPKLSTDYLYQLSKDVNYIKSDRLKQNIHWLYSGKYGTLQMTINLAKPEKDPKEIALAKSRIIENLGNRPQCVLCKENEHNYWNARMNLRIVPLVLGDETWHFQYSPYLYYNEHAIILHDEHRPMKLSRNTFTYLFDFIDLFPSYFIGSNADIPIVGGSILNHDHFQAGKHHFPIENAEVIESFDLMKDVSVSHINWPLSTIRFSSKYRNLLEDLCSHFLDEWKLYKNIDLDILPFTECIPHNTITPILRKRNGFYEMDLILRNNRTNEKYPDGIFHPHPDVQHIKKENIGLIEAMGLAILPGRLKTEIQLSIDYLNHKGKLEATLEKHLPWLKELSTHSTEFIDEHFFYQEIGKKFERVIEDSGVFKLNKTGNAAMHQFIIQTIKKHNH